MSYIRLHKDAFFRRYGNVGYLWQQIDRRSIVIDNNGAMFFEELTRSPQTVQEISTRLSQKYNGVKVQELEQDYVAFMQKFIPLNFVLMADTPEALTAQEKTFSYAALTNHTPTAAKRSLSATEQEATVNDFLINHFEEHPQLLSLQIEITPNCNLRCVHCYLSCGLPNPETNISLSTEQICKVLDEFKAMGGLQVTFTGGEAMLNKDLPKLLRYARKKDLDIWILSNAALLSDELLDVMKETNVAGVQVSLYSMVDAEHDAVTQVKGSCAKSKKSIEKLIEANIPVQLACPIMKENFHSFETVLQWGHERHLEVKTNSNIFAKADFSTENLTHRISLQEQEEIIKRTLKNSTIYQERLLTVDPRSNMPQAQDPVCGAGRYMLCLETSGNFYPCPGFKLLLGNCKTQSLQEIWAHSPELNKLRHLTNAAYGKCLKCPSRMYCNLCPGKLYNESAGDMFKLSGYFCEVAHINRRIAEEFMAQHKK